MFSYEVFKKLTSIEFNSVEDLENQIDSILILEAMSNMNITQVPQTERKPDKPCLYRMVDIKNKFELIIPFGETENGEVVNLELSKKTPNAFVAGASGSGKSNLVKVLCCQIMQNYTPKQVEIWYLDQKGGVEAAEIEEAEHVKVATYRAHDSAKKLEELKIIIEERQVFLREESLKRKQRFKKMSDFNRFVDEKERVTYILCIIDELEPFKGLETKIKKQFELSICEMLSLCRAAGKRMPA